MEKLKTNYMGIELDNPIIVGSSNLSNDLDTLKKAEDSGAAAIVYKSLFEEQIQLERFKMEEELTAFDDIHAEMQTLHPKIEHAGPEEHLINIKKARESLTIPLIASLNAINKDTWIEYARLLSETGVNGIELNFYQTPTDFSKNAKDIQDEQVSIIKEIKKSISIPVSVKLSSEYTNVLNLINSIDQAGVDAFVLFNSFFMPDIDINNEKHIKQFNLSNKGDYKKSLRTTGLLFENIKADICSSHGIHNGTDTIRLILAGASCVQMVSSLYKHGLSQIEKSKQKLEEWMEEKNYNSIDEFKGKLSKNKLSKNPFIYKRAQYVELLINSGEIIGTQR